MQQRLCSVSIDLDPLRCYYEIHALGAPPAFLSRAQHEAPRGSGVAALQQVILRRALPRFAEIFVRRNMHATFFVVGSDLDDEGARARVRELARAGHEIGNHSHTHPYDLARRDEHEIRGEIFRAHDAIADATGKAPVGFRAPGYDVSARMLDALAARTYLYDSSIFPAPLYWSAKAAVMGAMALRRRPSGAVLGNPRALGAPLDPYRPDARAPWRRGQSSLVELPVSVTRGLRVPVIGTWILTAPTAIRTRLLESMRARRFFNFELHGIDLIDADADGIPAELVEKQPDLRVPLVTKLRNFEATLDRLAPDFRFVTLREVAVEVQREGRL